MSSEVSKFWSRLIRAGIADEPICRSIAQSFRKSMRPAQPPSVAELADFMVDSGWLTPFQRDALLADPPVEFRVGRFVIRDQTAAEPFGRMVSVGVAKDVLKPGAGPPKPPDFAGVLLRVTKVLEGAESHWLEPYAGMEDPSLQSYQVDDLGDYELVFSPLPQGSLLREVWQWEMTEPNQPASRHRVCQIGASLARALAQLHARGITHGSVRMDRVWVPSDPGEPMQLLFEPTANLFAELESPLLSMAPERITDPSEPHPQTDLYALGCLLFALAVGRHPFTGDEAAIKQMHLREIPPELRDAVEHAEHGDPLMRVLAYAMAKDPAARFPSAEAFHEALVAVAQLIGPSDEKVEKPSQVVTIKSSQPPDHELAQLPIPPPASPVAPREQTKHPPRESPRQHSPPLRTTPPPQPTLAPAGPSKPPPSPEIKASVSAQPNAETKHQPRSQSVRQRPRKRKLAPRVLAGLAAVVLMQVVYLAVTDPQPRIVKRAPVRPVIPDVIPAVSSRSLDRAEPTGEKRPGTRSMLRGREPDQDRGFQMVADERLLYTPPYAGSNSPVDLELLPPGPAMLVSVEGEVFFGDAAAWQTSVMELLLPRWQETLAKVLARVKIPAENIVRVTLSFYPGTGGRPEIAISLRLETAMDFEELTRTLDVSSARTQDGSTIFAGDDGGADAYYFRDEEMDSKQITAMAIGSIERISELAAIDGESIPLPRTMENLWQASDVDADVCLMTTPNFLFADGRRLLEEVTPGLIDPLRRHLIPDASALLVVLDWQNDRLYGEWRIAAAGSITEASLSRSLRDMVDRWPQWARSIAARKDHPQRLEAIANRMPAMTQFVTDQTRVGISDATATVNVYLPIQTIPQLAFATLYAAGLPAIEATASTEATENSLSLEEVLALKMSIAFDAEDMQPALEVVLDSLAIRLPEGTSKPTVKIMGSDLQKRGITQNQQIRDFSRRDVAFRDVLTALMVSANPDKSATGPQDEKQALIWAIHRIGGEPSGAAEIVITTREAAEGVYEIPAEFQP